jgi:CheY-like chemotaxis protein
MTPPLLYVDDEENDALLLQIALEQAAIVVPLQLAANGVQALDYLLGRGGFADRARHPLPQLVLLDFKLPLVGGLQVLERMREEPSLRAIPVVMFSSSPQPSDQQRARELGATDYWVKPTGMDGFIAVAKLLRERWLSPGQDQ